MAANVHPGPARPELRHPGVGRSALRPRRTCFPASRRVSDGAVNVNERPGWGIEMDEQLAAPLPLRTIAPACVPCPASPTEPTAHTDAGSVSDCQPLGSPRNLVRAHLAATDRISRHSTGQPRPIAKTPNDTLSSRSWVLHVCHAGHFPLWTNKSPPSLLGRNHRLPTLASDLQAIAPKKLDSLPTKTKPRCGHNTMRHMSANPTPTLLTMATAPAASPHRPSAHAARPHARPK